MMSVFTDRALSQEGKGFTTPATVVTGGRVVTNQNSGSRQGAGRCVNAVCRQGAPPEMGPGAEPMDAGETWCDSSPVFGGRVVNLGTETVLCRPPDRSTAEAAAPCNDVGQFWGVCSAKPSLPSLAFDYDPESMAALWSLAHTGYDIFLNMFLQSLISLHNQVRAHELITCLWMQICLRSIQSVAPFPLF